MKKLFFVILCVAVALCSCKKTEEESKVEAPKVEFSNQDRLPIAVVSVDTIMAHYTFAVESQDMLERKQEDLRLELTLEDKSLQNEMADFQKKVENNAFLSRERAESEYARLNRKAQKLQEKQETKTQELLIESQNLSIQIRDSLNGALNIINADGKYHLILSNSGMTDNVLFFAEQYDITYEVLDLLNERFEKANKKKK